MECCLCGVAEEDHRKRRKLHGHSCEVARTVLLNMSRFALSYSETKKPSAILCLACDKLLRYIMATEKKLELLRGKVTEKLERLQGSSSSLVSCETPSNSKRPRLDHGMQLQQLPTDLATDTQPEAQGNLENDVHSSQDSGSLEQLADMEISEYLDTTAEQTLPANNLLLSQNRGALHQHTESTPGQSPPVKVSSKIAIAFYKLCYL